MTMELAAELEWASRYPAESADPHCLDPGRIEALLHGTPWRRVVGIGDSVAAGVREATAGYEDLGGFERVVRGLAGRAGFRYEKLARRGATVRDVLDQQVERAASSGADLALVAVGGNDALLPTFDPDTFARDLGRLLDQLIAAGTDVAVLGLFDLPRSGLLPEEHAVPMAARFDVLDAETRRVATAQGAVFVDNHVHPLAASPSIFASDLMHCNARGHAVSAATLTLALAEAGAA